ncbi:MAG: LacI family DNA-binding transcriptional regulator [Prolixibacteraceae bacterium]|nr:LacI family DNA-binding transcriptional regulator [Prolixibacteraceae bacterium]
MRSNQVTIKDIARKLGISPSTVSRALKDHPDISPQTKKSVNNLAKSLNYQPNAVALSLKHSRSFIIGVIIPETVHYFFSSVISGIEDIAYDAGYNVMICQSAERYEREVSNSQMLYSNRVEGLLVSLSKNTENFDHLKFFPDNNIPIVFFDRGTDNFPCDQVLIDDYKAAYNATELLIKRGHKKLIHLSAPQNLNIGLGRYKGFQDAIINNGIAPLKINSYLADNFEMADSIVEKLIKSGDIPDGIFAVNDLTALGAVYALKRNGIKIPEQVGVIGFGNGQNTNLTDPPLSTIDQNGYEMGKVAAQLLLKRINSDIENFTPEKHIIDTQLIIRKSTK